MTTRRPCDYDLYWRLLEPTVGLVDWRKNGKRGDQCPGAGSEGDDRARRPRPRTLVDEELPLAKAFGTHRAIGMALHTAGLLEHGEARVQALKHATEELARSQSRLEYAGALCDYGAALRRGQPPGRSTPRLFRPPWPSPARPAPPPSATVPPKS